jgi:BNR repeat protein
MRPRTLASILVCLGLVAVAVSCADDREPLQAGSTALRATGLKFTNTALLRPDGASEPAISIGADGTMAVSALSWQNFFTHAWKGPFGSTPVFQGEIDADLGSGVGGGEDADIDLGSTGALHATTLLAFFNPVLQITQLGVSAIACPNADTSNNFSACTRQIIDTTQSDRQWVTSDGPRVYISYHDSGSSTTIHVQRSDDDGVTWKKVGDPVVGQGGTTGASTFNNDQGPIVADPTTHSVFAITAAGTASVQKGSSASFNQIFVTRSTDFGATWTAALVFNAPFGSALNNVFPALAVDPANGALYAAWSDAHTVALSRSTDHGATWSSPVSINVAPASTAVFPWIAALNGVVDVVYYGTTASSKDDPSAVWNTYLSQSVDGGAHFAQFTVSDHPNHVGPICTGGISCAPGTRNLLDLFEIALDPRSGKAGVIYVDDTLTTSGGKPLPQVVLAQQQ